MSVQFNDNNASLKIKRVYYEGTDSLLPGYLLCYNNDVTTDMNGTTVAEGSQCPGKYLRVEKPASANLMFFAGVVVTGVSGPAWVDIYEPNGAQMAVYTAANCTMGSTVLGLKSGSYLACADYSIPGMVANETVNRSSTNGLVLAMVSAPLGAVTTLNGYFAPIRPITTGDFYGVKFDVSNAFTEAGTAGPRSWGVGITGDKTSGDISVAGCDDAALRINVSCRTVNTSVFTFRGLNCAAVCGNTSGSDPGYVGALENLISTATKLGSTSVSQIGLYVVCENYGTASGTFGGIKIDLRNEGSVATSEFGIHITNTNDSVTGPVNAVFKVDDTSVHGVNTGFTNLLYVPTAGDLGIIAASGDITFSAADKLIPIKIGTTTYYLVATDNV